MAGKPLSAAMAAEALSALKTHGTEARAAEQLGISRTTLQSRLMRARLMKKPYERDDLPAETPDAGELLERRRKQYAKKAKAADARKLIPIRITCDGPIAIAHFGDPHVDDDGTNISLLEDHVRVVNKTEGMFAGNVGDYRNNWIGRLARLWSQQSTSAEEAKVLARWLIESMDWLYLVGGNHDAWSGSDDPIAWIAEQQHALHQPHAARLGTPAPEWPEGARELPPRLQGPQRVEHGARAREGRTYRLAGSHSRLRPYACERLSGAQRPVIGAHLARDPRGELQDARPLCRGERLAGSEHLHVPGDGD
jgi:hypothetical protein